MNKIKAKCLECQTEIILNEDLMVGEVVTCPECSSDFEVLKVKPLKLGPAPEVQEDWGQ